MIDCIIFFSEKRALPYLAFESEENPDGIALYLIFLVVDWFFYLALILLIDYGYFGEAINFIKTHYLGSADVGRLDSDVQEERDRVDAVRDKRGMIKN